LKGICFELLLDFSVGLNCVADKAYITKKIMETIHWTYLSDLAAMVQVLEHDCTLKFCYFKKSVVKHVYSIMILHYKMLL
jgi:hypothetical protein